GDLCGDHYAPVDYCRSLEAGSRNNRFSGFDGTLCIWRLDIHTVSPDWSGRGEVALYPRNEFFFHRSDHNGWTGRRITPYIRGVYCGSPDRDGNQPDIQVYAFYHNSTGIGHRGAADRT